MCLFYNLAISYDRCSYLSSLLFLYPKTEFVSRFAFVLCSPFPSADWALLDCVIGQKVRDITFKAILSPSERYQNIQDNPENNSVLPFRKILEIFAVNKSREYKMEMYNFECSCVYCQKPMLLFYTRWTLSTNCPSRKFFLVHIWTEYGNYGLNLRDHSKCKKIRTRKNSVFGHFSRSEKHQKTTGPHVFDVLWNII